MTRATVRATGSWWKTGIALLLTAIMLFPVYWMLNNSLTRDEDMRRTPPSFFPAHPTLDGYRAVLDQQLPYLGTSLLVGLGTVLLTVMIAAPAGYALGLLRPRGSGALSFLLLAAQMIPGIIMAMGFYAIYLNLGVLNTLPGLILADSTLAVPFGVLIFTAFMAGIPRELLQASRVDGAGTFRTFWSIVLPMSLPAVMTIVILSFQGSWNELNHFIVTTQSTELTTLTKGVAQLASGQLSQGQQFPIKLAASLLMTIPVAIVFFIFQKRIMNTSEGAVKG